MYLLIQLDRLSHITDIEFDIGIWLAIGNLKIKPKQMPPRIGVNPQKQIILILGNFNHTIQISGLKPGIELKFFLFVNGGVHTLKSPIINLIFVKLILTHSFLQIE